MAAGKKTNDESNYKKIEKDLAVKKEIKKLTQIFKDIDPKIKKTVESLIQNCAFMAVTLRELQETINTDGLTCEYQNGENQFGVKKSPEVEIYNTMIKNFVSSMNSLTSLLPKGVNKIEDDGFEEFVNRK